MSNHVAVDIGGTFTDLVSIDAQTGAIEVAKTLSTPPAFGTGVANALAMLDEPSVEAFVHGTTVVINALTERKGTTTALITTQGFRDILEIQRANRPDLFNLMYEKPTPYVSRELRLEVPERTSSDGKILEAVDLDCVVERVQEALSLGAESIALSFLHSYVNGANEQAAKEVIEQRWPGLPVSVSSEISGEWREYPRTSTAVLDAYVKPTVRDYLRNLETALDAFDVPGEQRFLMQSSGGAVPFALGARTPISLVESGPVGAVTGAAFVGGELGEANVISLDIGGTTAKAALVEEIDGELSVPVIEEYYIDRSPITAGFPIRVPCVDIVEIGAGGGSIAWIDDAGALHVGPRSAGADPGPACYGKGGTEPTLTDANLITGRLDAERFLGGDMQLRTDLARKSIQPIANHLGVTIEDAAIGIIRLANNKMVQLLRLVSIRRGKDPREFALIASGGNGSLHATALARELQIPRVVVPRHPGHFSAWGMLVSNMRQDTQTTFVASLDESFDQQSFATAWSELEQRLRDRFGGDPADLTFQAAVDMRYLGQEHTVRVPVHREHPSSTIDLADLVTRFGERHEKLFAFSQESATEIITLRLTGTRERPQPPQTALPTRSAIQASAPRTREVHFDDFGAVETPVVDRDALVAAQILTGPVIVQEQATTTVVYPDQVLEVTASGSMIIRRKAN